MANVYNSELQDANGCYIASSECTTLRDAKLDARALLNDAEYKDGVRVITRNSKGEIVLDIRKGAK